MSIDIDAILERANAATPGPWEWHGHPFQDVTGKGLETFYSVWVSGKPQLAARGDAVEPVIGKRETMIFIAAARQDVPALCAEVRELRAALGRLQGEVETILNTEPHANNCRVVSRECNCWQARLSKALDGDK